MKPFFLYTLLVLLFAWVVAMQAGCFAMRTPDARWPEKLRSLGQTLLPNIFDVRDAGGRRIHGVYLGASDTLPCVVFVHGSPGSADAYLHCLGDTLLSSRVRMATLDRPGFGYTEGFGRAEGSLTRQAQAVKAVVEALSPQRPVILVGHSLGGPVIARFAMDYPESTAGLVFLASSIDPSLEEKLWWQPVVNNFPVSWLIPRSFWTSNREIMDLREELQRMMPGWAGIECPVRVVHATDDSLVPVGNAEFARKALVKAQMQVDILPKGDHFILWSRLDMVRTAVLDLLPHH